MDHYLVYMQFQILIIIKVIHHIYCIVWNCIIFMRKGFFKDGKFKFDVTFTH